MSRYLLSIYQPDGDPPPPHLLEPVMRDINALVQDAKAAGVWVFNGGLHPPGTARTLGADLHRHTSPARLLRSPAASRQRPCGRPEHQEAPNIVTDTALSRRNRRIVPPGHR